jgi:polyisoprenoid-binding protein YceI
LLLIYNFSVIFHLAQLFSIPGKPFKPLKMKRNKPVQIILYSIAACIAITACDNAPKGDNAVITEEQKATEITGQTFMVDTSSSTIRFTGYGVGKQHPGKFKVSSGTVAIKGNDITGGEFTIRIKSMEMEEKGDIYRDKLRPHLLSGDFFDADNFQTAKFEITKVEPYKADDKDTSIIKGANFNISGNLTIKDVTKNITFPAHVDLDASTLKAKADFDIDRTQWKINYGSDKTLGDKFISEKVNIELDVQAKVQ